MVMSVRSLSVINHLLVHTKYHQRTCVNFYINKRFIASKRQILRLFSCNYFENVEKRLCCTQPKNDPWIRKYEHLMHQITTSGVGSLEDKFIPRKSTKPKAEGDTSHHFIDYIKVRVVAGNGGDGCINFQQVFINPKGGPGGGDGGNGGHVFFKATRNKKSLSNLDAFIMAKSGEEGRSKDCHGKSALDLVVEVPVGTLFKLEGSIVANLEEGDVFIAGRGGAGGKGNSFFTNSIDQAPKVAEFGGKGETFVYEIELQIMADIGLIGFPNAGKSTLLRSISRARPKVASYPFTTLNPHVGMVSFEDLHQMAIADIPGLVKGSHANEGLGMAFLKHIQRCSSLLYVLDASDEDPLQQLRILRDELEEYEPGLSERPHAIVLNKIDVPGAKEKLPILEDELNLPLIPISAKMGHNLVPLLAVMRLLTETEGEHNQS